MKSFVAILVSLFASSAIAFAPIVQNARPELSLKASKGEVGAKAMAVSVVTGAFLAINVAATPALAADNTVDFFGSSEVIAARSGGRAGGRASSGGARSSYSRPSTSSYSTYRSTTIVAPPPSPTVIVSPPVTYGYSYNPLGGLGMGYALGSMNSVGNQLNDIRQEGEIQRSKVELEQARAKEAELEARLRSLEMQQVAK